MRSWTHQLWLVRRSNLLRLESGKVNWPGRDKSRKLGKGGERGGDKTGRISREQFKEQFKQKWKVHLIHLHSRRKMKEEVKPEKRLPSYISVGALRDAQSVSRVLLQQLRRGNFLPVHWCHLWGQVGIAVYCKLDPQKMYPGVNGSFQFFVVSFRRRVEMRKWGVRINSGRLVSPQQEVATLSRPCTATHQCTPNNSPPLYVAQNSPGVRWPEIQATEPQCI